MKNSVLFICTGNYYRSRYAEILFNHYAQRCGLNCRAFSRGFQESTRPLPLSLNARKALDSKGINLKHTRFPIKLQNKDLLGADHIILMDEIEHRSMLVEDFPQWINRVEFWQIRDIDFETPQCALPKLELELEKLLNVFIIEKATA